jgi:hydroxymethylpyrimidine pyrophosphatase-like HAD family hydrolase
MKQKAIIFDIDGTVVDSPEQKMPSRRVVEAFNKKREEYFLCAATGRPWTS